MMFTKLKDIPEHIGDIDGVDYPADIAVKVTTDKGQRDYIQKVSKTISLDKEYHIYKITAFGDVFDVWIINDLGQSEDFCDCFFEDIN